MPSPAPAKSANPAFNSVDGYLINALTVIMESNQNWEGYVDAASIAYSQAYNGQAKVLGGIAKAIEDQKKRDEMIATFVLSVVTVGVGGGLASAAIKRWGTPALEKMFENTVDKIAEKAQEKVKEPLKGLTEWVVKGLGPATSEEAFKPSGIPPDQYGSRMKKSVHLITRGLLKILRSFQAQGSAGMTLNDARDLTDRLLNTEFVKNPPPDEAAGDDFQNDLAANASLGLWLAWAWGRDKSYWQVHNTPALFQRELNTFASVHSTLIALGAPADTISQFGMMGRRVIDMNGLIEWSFSHDAQASLMQALPKNPTGSQYARMELHNKLMIMRAFGPAAAGFVTA